jgi:hypothetical protein
MSTKTLRKRIALVAVSALGAGLLSVVAVPSANAADGTVNTTDGSVGLVGALAGSGTTRTAVLLSTGTLVLGTTANTTVAKVSAGAKITSSTTVGNIAADQSCSIVGASDTISITPTGAAGSTFTVTTYDEDTCAAAATPADVITVTIAGASAAGVATAANSTVRWASDGSSDEPTAAEDVTNSTASYTTNALYLYITLADAYDQDVTSGSGALVVTATEGALVGTPASPAAAGTGNVGVTNTDPSGLWVKVTQKTVGAGWSGTVTVTYNGVLMATKTGKITGAPASLAVSPYKIGATSTDGGEGTTAWLYTVKDAAGNPLAFTSSGISLDSSSNKVAVADAAGGTVNAELASLYGAYVGGGNITCAKAGTSTVVVKLVNPNGAVVKSNPFTATCGGDAYEYSASFDKASYVQGELATLTVTFKDSTGALANSYQIVETGTYPETDATISAPMMVQVGGISSSAGNRKPNKDGQLKFTFTVGTSTGLTDGSYNAVVSFPTVDSAVSASYKVTTGSTGVSNADVLKAIVSLIASINKQIAALQKALLKK